MMRNVVLALAVSLAIGDAASAQTVPPAGSIFGFDRQEIVFGMLANDPAILTPPQRVFVESLAQQGLPWTAASDSGWLHVEPVSGKIPARLTVSVDPAQASRAHDEEGHVVVTVMDGDVPLRQALTVKLRVLRERVPPIGALDAPADGTLVTGVVRLSGWALHDIRLRGVAICRDPVSHSVRNDACGPDLAPIGDATVYYNLRPDVAAAVGPKPSRERSGWTYVLKADSFPKGAQGTVRIYAVATGMDGTRAVIGERTITVLPPSRSLLDVSPRTRLIILVLFGALAFHLLLRWLCLRRLPEPDSTEPSTGVPVAPVEWLGIAAIVGLSLAMNLPVLSRSSLTHDELYTASHYAVGVPLWTAAFHVQTFTNHIAYSLLAALSARLLGPTEFAIRFPAAILGALAILALWRYARLWAGRWIALASALLLALMPFHTHWCRMARGYTGMALMTVLAAHGFSSVVRTGSRRGAIEHAIALTLAVHFHLYAAFVFLVQYLLFAAMGLASASRRGTKGPLTRRSFALLWLSFLAAGAAIVILYAPVVNGFLDALPFFASRDTIRPGLFVQVFNTFSSIDSTATRSVLAVLVGLGVVELWRRSRVDAVQLALLILIPVSAVVLIFRPRIELERYFGFWSPGFALFIASGASAAAVHLSRWPSRAVRTIAIAVSVALLVAVAVLWAPQDARVGPSGGYGEMLQPLNNPPRLPVLVVGADADMFQFYVRQPLEPIHSIEELEQRLFNEDGFRVAYHNVSWNSPEQRQVAALLQRRCSHADRGTVGIYECGTPTRRYTALYRRYTGAIRAIRAIRAIHRAIRALDNLRSGRDNVAFTPRTNPCLSRPFLSLTRGQL